MMAALPSVSSPSESLILVDSDDREVGFKSKAECHTGDGVLHRALSVFLFDSAGQTLLQQRSAQKPLWPLYWSNSCCSHPRQAESIEAAAKRRVREELQLECELEFLYKFEYQAGYKDIGSEHELCHVFAGKLDARQSIEEIAGHPDEIAGLRLISPTELTREIARHGDRYTPWLKLEWARISTDYLDGILK